MNADAVRGLISRRGSVVQWAHASPVPAANMNTVTQGPKSTGLAGIGTGPRNEGAMEEGYAAFFPIRAYFSGKVSSSAFMQWGIVEAGDAQLDVAVPFAPDGAGCIGALPPALLDAYNNGRFAVIRGQTTVTFDRFIIGGVPYVAKAVPVPLVDSNITFAWRILVAKETY